MSSSSYVVCVCACVCVGFFGLFDDALVISFFWFCSGLISIEDVCCWNSLSSA